MTALLIIIGIAIVPAVVQSPILAMIWAFFFSALAVSLFDTNED